MRRVRVGLRLVDEDGDAMLGLVPILAADEHLPRRQSSIGCAATTVAVGRARRQGRIADVEIRGAAVEIPSHALVGELSHAALAPATLERLPASEWPVTSRRTRLCLLLLEMTCPPRMPVSHHL